MRTRIKKLRPLIKPEFADFKDIHAFLQYMFNTLEKGKVADALTYKPRNSIQ